MIKLYKTENGIMNYWETWENNGVYTIHWGKIGETGESKELRKGLFGSLNKTINSKINEKKTEGYAEIPDEELKTLLIEYKINGMGTESDLDKRHNLENKMNETLGWTGLGHCDGGSIGSGTMEVCCYVVDFEIAKSVIIKNLKGTEFENYSKIYDENKDK